LLKARLHWRHAERERMLENDVLEREEQENRQRLFREAIELFTRHKTALDEHIAESRLRTVFGIALYRTGRNMVDPAMWRSHLQLILP
jgi:hypothetical protein